jgi:glycosyltransferase involved in cell wall biosynthesis
MSVDVSVVIPTYRRPDTLIESVSSALSQESVSIEVIVVDDCPHRSAEPAISGIRDTRIRYVPRAQNSGGRPALVRNEGLRFASGRYIHFLDDDDHAARGAYRSMVDAFESRPDVGVVFGRIEPFGNDPSAVEKERAYFAEGAQRASFAARMHSRHLMVANMLYLNTPLVNSACMIRRKCADMLGGYDARIPVCEDVEFYIRAIRRFGFVYLDQVVVEYRYQPDSLMHGESDKQKELERGRDSYGFIYENYGNAHGKAELFAIKAFSRSLLPVLQWGHRQLTASLHH